jgi:DNA-binding transcriptional LysR family regulator
MQPGEGRTHESLLADISARQLRAFVTVAETLSYAEAAEILHYSEPGVFAQVKRLEAMLGCKLFERHGRGVRLTEAGVAMLDVCRLTLAGFERIDNIRQRFLRRRRVRVIAGIATGSYALPPLIRAFVRQHPEARVDLTTAPAEDLIGLIEAGAGDLALAAGLSRFPLPAGFALTHWLDEPYALLTSAEAAPASPPAIVYLLPREPQQIGQIARYLTAAGIEEYELRSLDTTDAIKGACQAGLGYALLPRRAAQLELQAGLLSEVRVDGDPYIARIDICHATEEKLAPEGHLLLRFLRENSGRVEGAFLPTAGRAPASGLQ